MQELTSKGKSFLWFPDEPVITHKWETIGLIAVPEEGNNEIINYFRIFISGNTKDKVQNFVDYQKQKTQEFLNNPETADVGIQIVVRKLPESFSAEPAIETTMYSPEEVETRFKEAQFKEPDFLSRLGDINIGIDRIDMHTQPPYEIIYTIDPETKQLAQGGKHSFQFSADDPFVSCKVSLGAVEMSIYELTQQQTWNKRDGGQITVGHPRVTPRIAKQFTGNWQAEVIATGILNSVFTLEYSKLVLR